MKFGTSRLPLNWPVGIPLAGYVNRTLPSVGCHRELYIRVTVISSDDDAVSFCLVSGEVLSVDSALTGQVREAIRRELNIPTDAIMVAATHTHASVGGLTQFPVPGKSVTVLGEYSPERVAHFVDVALCSARQAFQTQTRVSLWSGNALTHGIAANRRDPNGINDPRLPLLMAKDDSGAVRGILFSYACHSTILSADNRLYSGDLIGTACALLEGNTPTEVAPLATSEVVTGLTGAAGDISTRFTRREATVGETERMASVLVNAIHASELQPLAGEHISYARQQVILPTKPAPARNALLQSLADAQARLVEMQNHPQRRIIEAEIEGLQVQLNMGERPKHVTTEVQVFRVGNAVIISLPGELFVAYGLELKAKLAPAPVLIAGYANDYIGYVTTPEANDGYEVDSAIVPAQAGNMLVQAALQLIE